MTGADIPWRWLPDEQRWTTDPEVAAEHDALAAETRKRSKAAEAGRRRRAKTAQCTPGLGWPESLTGKGNAIPLKNKGNRAAQPTVDTPP